MLHYCQSWLIDCKSSVVNFFQFEHTNKNKFTKKNNILYSYYEFAGNNISYIN